MGYQYIAKVKCQNCGFTERIKIVKGFLISERRCPRCECAEVLEPTIDDKAKDSSKG